VREGKRTKEKERVIGKAAGDECVFISDEGPGLADEVGSDAIPDTAGGEGDHGAANPDGVIYRFVFNRSYSGREWIVIVLLSISILKTLSESRSRLYSRAFLNRLSLRRVCC
jgi:hypothetical protein